jgi:acyl-coenzyme A thioesterase PaaI-like protein
VSDSLGWGPILDRLRTVEPGSRRAELHRAGAALRTAVHRIVRVTGDPAAIGRAADAIEAMVAQLEELPIQVEYEGFAEASISGGEFGFFDRGPMLGNINPLAPPLEMWQDGDRMLGRAFFGPAYEGPPGCVHGGYVAAAFDELLGCTQTMSGAPGMTGRLSVSYRSPTPLETELRFEGRITDVSGRKILTSGTLSAGDRLCAEAEALFISVDGAKFAALRDERAERASQPD